MRRQDYINKCADVHDEKQHERFSEYIGSWGAFEKLDLGDATYYIYEHNKYGDETCYLVVKYINDMPIDIYETYDNIIECLIDEEIIDVID